MSGGYKVEDEDEDDHDPPISAALAALDLSWKKSDEPGKQMPNPKLYHVANLWSLTDYPSAVSPWSLEEQLDAAQ
jgi:hypothetical protein